MQKLKGLLFHGTKQDFLSVSYSKSFGHGVNTREGASIVLLGCHDMLGYHQPLMSLAEWVAHY